MYYLIFFTNVRRILDEQSITKNELAKRSGVSISFLSSLISGKANPSLKVMEAIAVALETPLSILLEAVDLEQSELDSLAGGKLFSSLPPGFEWVFAILPHHQGFLVRRWEKETKTKLRNRFRRQGKGMAKILAAKK